ncbi:hypothetical protein ABEV74_17745 [Paenibacillus cisolokensis]|jgi:hypothetical protein|uniref:DUF2007 domain-containing protein n=1 Tax=Paenibacillus cisolokensis TaxID=1658519 RepID=A0ABQ4N7Q3_9BACL|nr:MULTISPECIES: hypothetical protein [Paenibacillus]ALS26843.1 hypothetical protein IJ21_14390 [Paenibacillus sp. 32O-W]GIQ64283.1 hypothetical protein PACILC2_28510 [Paenibacillus cisolokensis]
METLFIALGIAALIVLAAVLSGGKWRTIRTARTDNADELQTRSAYLVDKGVRNRLKTSDTAVPQAGIASGNRMSAGGIIHLQVHPKDKDRANELLQKFDSEYRLKNKPIL